jgi:hypothetical protein
MNSVTKKMKNQMIGGNHYLNTTIQPWDVVRSWSHPNASGFENYLYGNVLKYLQRYRRKGHPKQDLEKAKHYLMALIEELSNEHC